MPTALTDFTTYDEIRAVLGVSDEEIENSTLALGIYVNQLKFMFVDISTTLESTYVTAREQVTPTVAQSRLITVMEVFSAYAIAKILLTSIPLFAPRKINDGSAALERVNDPFQMLREEVNLTYKNLLARLTKAAADLALPIIAGRAQRVMSLVSPLATSQITNA